MNLTVYKAFVYTFVGDEGRPAVHTGWVRGVRGGRARRDGEEAVVAWAVRNGLLDD